MKFFKVDMLKKTRGRRVSNSERLWLASSILEPPFANQMVLEGTGIFDKAKWEYAVEKASDVNPGSRMILSGHLFLSTWKDSGITPPVRIIENSDWEGMSDRGADFLYDDFNFRDGHTCEVILIQGERPKAVFRSLHAVMDGRGTMTWAEDIFRVLRGEIPLGSDFLVKETDLLNLDDSGLAERLSSEFISPGGKGSGNGKGIIWRRRQIIGKVPGILYRVALIAAEQAWKRSEGHVRFAIPVDLRQRKPGLRSTGNLSNAVYADIFPGLREKDFAKMIRTQLEQQYDGELTWEDKILKYIPLRYLVRHIRYETLSAHKSGTYRISGMISNPGLINKHAFSGGGFNTESVFFIPPCIGAIPFFIVLSGTESFTDITLAMPGVFSQGEFIDEIIDEIISKLKETN